MIRGEHVRDWALEDEQFDADAGRRSLPVARLSPSAVPRPAEQEIGLRLPPGGQGREISQENPPPPGSELGGMEKLSAESRQKGLADMHLRRCAIENVSDQRMLERGEVYPDLMRSSGVELDFDERRGTELDDFAPLGKSFAKLSSGNMLAGFCRRYEGFHSSSVDWIAADGKIDLSGRLIEGAFNQRKVSFLDGAGAERFG